MQPWSPSGRLRRSALMLLAALLPMLAYVGHWPKVAIPIPGTNVTVSLPFVSAEESPGDHHQHCHAGAAECSNGPGPLALGVSLLAGALALVIPNGPLRLVPGAATGLRRQHEPAPDLKPPRPAPFPARPS